MIESGLLSTRIFLAEVTLRIGQEKYLSLILCWKIIYGPIKFKKRFKRRKNNKEFLRKRIAVD